MWRPFEEQRHLAAKDGALSLPLVLIDADACLLYSRINNNETFLSLAVVYPTENADSERRQDVKVKSSNLMNRQTCLSLSYVCF